MCVSTLRLIRPVDEASVLEVIKEFFYLVGCLFCDKPVHSQKDAEMELGKDYGTDFDVVLNLNVFGWGNGRLEWDDVLRWDGPGRISERWADSFIGDSGFIARDDRRIFVMYQLPERKKMKFCRELIEKMIINIWNSEEETAQREQLLEINRLFFKTRLFGFLQSSRSLRMMNMGEALELDLGRQTVPADGYIENMLLAFSQFYQDTILFQRESGAPPYARYANINIARKIREVFRWIDKKPAAQSRDGGVPQVTYCSAAYLLAELEKLYREEPGYLGTLFLSARVCQSEPSQEQNAGSYYQKLFETIAKKDQRAYSFIYYEYGRYIERTEYNWDRALRYYERSVKLTPLSYRAIFKLACHEAGKRDFSSAWGYFRRVVLIICREFSGRKPIQWENLSLPCIQYLFKTYIWIWKICVAAGRYSEAQAYLRYAWRAARAYRENECLRKVYNPESKTWRDLENYHKNSIPVSLLYEIVQSRLAYTNMLMQ